MKKLKEYLDKWFDGHKVRGLSVTPLDIRECERIYIEIANGKKPEFISGKVKEVLDKCKIETIEYGIGWRVV